LREAGEIQGRQGKNKGSRGGGREAGKVERREKKFNHSNKN